MDLSGELTSQLLDAAPDATVIVDAGGTIVFANARIQDVFGYERGELISRSVETLLPERFAATHPKHRETFSVDPRPRPMGIDLELYGLHKDGHEFPVEISLSPLRTASGLLVSGAIRDITERKAMERALVEARSEAERANRAKSAFLAAASHDLRQPLQTLKLLNATLGRIADPKSKTAEIAASESQALNSMSELLNALLDISKLEAGTVKPDIEHCSVTEIFDRLRNQFAALAEAKGLSFVVDDCQDVVNTDRTLLEQIIRNLVANAIRYTKVGLVQLRCLHESTFVQIDVVDTGVGIPANELNLIFEEFYQATPQPGQCREGLGLGLSIVRRVVDLLGLQFEVESTPGRGSRFTVNVPRGVVDRRKPLAAPSVTQRSLPGTDFLVLVIDDDDAVANATSMLLEIEGYQSIVAKHLEDARQRLSEIDGIPNLILCDFHLPGGPSGVETIRAIRHIVNSPIPALLVTGDTSTATSELAGNLDRCRLLSKPIDAEKLVELLLASLQ